MDLTWGSAHFLSVLSVGSLCLPLPLLLRLPPLGACASARFLSGQVLVVAPPSPILIRGRIAPPVEQGEWQEERTWMWTCATPFLCLLLSTPCACASAGVFPEEVPVLSLPSPALTGGHIAPPVQQGVWREVHTWIWSCANVPLWPLCLIGVGVKADGK